MAIQTQVQGNVVHFNESKIDLIKRVFCKGASQDEIELFVDICKKTGLDPVAKQIYFMKAGGTMVTITGIDGYRLIAERTGRYMPGREPTFTYDKSGNLLSATSYVKKLGPDNQWHEIAATAILKEYKKGNLWNSMPHAMIAKCSEALALRRAFPSDLSGLYTKEEMEQADPVEFSAKPEEPRAIEVQPSPDLITAQYAEYFESLIRADDANFRAYALGHFSKLAQKQLHDFTQLPVKYLDDCNKMLTQRQAQLKDQDEKAKTDSEW